MEKRLPNNFKTMNVTRLNKAILKGSWRVLQESSCLNYCMMSQA